MQTKQPIIVIGIGEIGSVIARALLRSGHAINPVTRETPMELVAKTVSNPEAVLVAVGESDLQSVLSELPQQWNDKVILIQNELLPKDYAGLDEPTVMSVWFEKKKGMDSKVVVASVAYGRHAVLLRNALEKLDIPVRVLQSKDELLQELVVKNLYILTSNIAGLKTGGTVSELWSQHRKLAELIAHEVIDIQEKLCGQQLDRVSLITGMLHAFEGDPDHGCTGRSAPARLARALQHADSFGLATPAMRSIADQTSST